MNKKLNLNEIDMTYILGNGSIVIETGSGVFSGHNKTDMTKKEKCPFIVLSWSNKNLPIGVIENIEDIIVYDKTLIIIQNLESLEILQESLNRCREILIHTK
jgi:hypothetical protein